MAETDNTATSTSSGATARLSKSRYVAGLQCPLRLWLREHQPDAAASPDAVAQARFDAGHEVGELARLRHPDGVLVDAKWRKEALAATAPLVADESFGAIFEAAIEHDGVLIRADILERLSDGRWRLIEVKSSTKPKDVHLDDLAIQAWVLRGAGFDLAEVCLLVINREYVYQGGDHDVDSLFVQHDLSERVSLMIDSVGPAVQNMRVMLAAAAPEMVVGPQCSTPYDCEFYAHCSADLEVPEHSIDELPRLSGSRRSELVQLGVKTIPEIPRTVRLTPTQERVRRCVANDQDYVAPGLAAKLTTAAFPRFHFDVETVMHAVPRHIGTRPYDPIPFQWSLHKEHADGRVDHFEFLQDDERDPREQFVESFLEVIEDEGAIVVYTSYEKRVLRELAEALPQRATMLNDAVDRLFDLCAVVRQDYYHPQFHGSYSLKRVLPALVPELGYDDLAIADGQTAAISFEALLEMPPGPERDTLREQLLAYCGRDTEALVALYSRLLERAAANENVASV